MEQIFWCPTDECRSAPCVITIANAVWCSNSHPMIPIGYINSRGEQVSTDIKMPKRVFPDA